MAAIQSSLAAQIDHVAAIAGSDVAQFYVRDADPGAIAQTMTFDAFARETRRRAAALTELGVGPGDVVTTMIPLGQTSYPTLFATLVTATAAPVNYFLKPEALIRLITAAGANVLLAARRFDDDEAAPEKIAAIRQAFPDLRIIAFGEGAPIEGEVDLDACAARQTGERWPDHAARQAAERVVALFHTGGTTGLPKLVPHTEQMYLSMLSSCGHAQGMGVGEIMLSALPLFHTSGALQAGLVPLLNGTGIVIPSARGFRDPGAIKNYWRFVSRYGVTVGAAVPTVLAALTASAPDCDVTSLKRMLCGAAPVSRTTIETIARLTDGAEVLEGWGMTETCGFSMLNPHGAPKVGSVGRPFPGVEAEIRKADAKGELSALCAVDEIGELVVRGTIVIGDYARSRPEAFTADGWLRTGDLARVDADGYFWITGRAKDIIIRGGHNIDPALIEEPAYQHPAVQLAAAIGKPDKYAGELPILFVQLKPGAEVEADALHDFVMARVLERAATPKEVHIVPAIPLSGPGKISKLELRRGTIARTFQSELDRLGLPLALTAHVVDDDRAGTLVVIESGGCVTPAARDAVAKALDGYPVSFCWKDEHGS